MLDVRKKEGDGGGSGERKKDGKERGKIDKVLLKLFFKY